MTDIDAVALQEINHDCIAEIFSHLDLPTFMICRQLCKDFCIAAIRTRGIRTCQEDIVDALGAVDPTMFGAILRCISRVTDSHVSVLVRWATQYANDSAALHVLRWSQKHVAYGFLGPDRRLFDGYCAAKTGNILVFGWMRDPRVHGANVYDWVGACSAAAECKDRDKSLQMLKWLRDPLARRDTPPDGSVCPWSTITCDIAAKNGHLDVLKWLRDPNTRPDGSICPWTHSACDLAAINGHFEVFKWLWDPNTRADKSICGCSPKICVMMVEHGRSGILPILKWMRAKGVFGFNLAKINDTAVQNGNVDVLKWINGEMCPWTPNACLLAATSGDKNVCKWLCDPGNHELCKKRGRCGWVGDGCVSEIEVFEFKSHRC